VPNCCFGTESLDAINKISRPLFEREPVPYNFDWIDGYRPNVDFYLSISLREQLREAGIRSQDSAGTYAKQIFHQLLIDLSYNSSRLEGNRYSIGDTEKLLFRGEDSDKKLGMEKIMLLNHKEAIRYLVDTESLQVNRNTICSLHYLLADGLIEAKYCGNIRDHEVRIGGSTFFPLESTKLLEQQETILAKAALIGDPFEQSFFLLIHISYLQAFADVNKRTARLSANIPLTKGNLVPLTFSGVKIKDYVTSMIAIYELQDVRPLIDLYVYSYMLSCAAYVPEKKTLFFDEVRVRFRQQRKSVIQKIILQLFFGKAMENLIAAEAEKLIPEANRQAFIQDILEDLDQINENRLVGMDVTPNNLNAWLQLRSN